MSSSHGANEVLNSFRAISKSLDAAPLSIGVEDVGGRRIYRLGVGTEKMLIVLAPIRFPRAGRPTPISNISLEVGEAQASRPWVARIIKADEKKTPRRAPVDKAPELLPVGKEGTRLKLNFQGSPTASLAFLIEAP